MGFLHRMFFIMSIFYFLTKWGFTNAETGNKIILNKSTMTARRRILSIFFMGMLLYPFELHYLPKSSRLKITRQ